MPACMNHPVLLLVRLYPEPRGTDTGATTAESARTCAFLVRVVQQARILRCVLCQKLLSFCLDALAGDPVVAMRATATIRLSVRAFALAVSAKVIVAVLVEARPAGDHVASAVHLHAHIASRAADLALDVVLFSELRVGGATGAGAKGVLHGVRQ